MPRNGSGAYNPPGTDFPAVASTLIESTKFNNVITDIGTALTGSLAADGQTTVTANLPMNSKKLTGLAAGIAAGDSVRFEQFASPPAIGNTAPAAGNFTTLGATGQITSTLANGTAPFVVASSTVVANLTARNLSGGTVAATTISGTTISASGVITSTVSTGTAPFTVSSTTPVENLSIGGSSASCTGNAANVTGTVAVANGGTGQTTAALAGSALGAVGVGQTWASYLGSRSLATPYTNSTGRPIIVRYAAGGNIGTYPTITVGALTFYGSSAGQNAYVCVVEALVTDGVTYQVNHAGLNGPVLEWNELRQP